MKRLLALLKVASHKVRNYISPVFLALLAVSFTLWYISKLDYTYTTDFNVDVSIEGQHIEVPCVIEGKGSNLIGYGYFSSKSVTIRLADLKYDIVQVPLPGQKSTDSIIITKPKVRVSPVAMQDALSVRFSDVKIVSVGSFPDLELEGPKR